MKNVSSNVKRSYIALSDEGTWNVARQSRKNAQINCWYYTISTDIMNKSCKILQWRFQEKQRLKKEVVPSCNKYDITISWIGYDMQQIMKDLTFESFEMGGVIVSKEYAIIVSWIDWNTQQLMEDLALEVQREKRNKRLQPISRRLLIYLIHLVLGGIAAISLSANRFNKT
ncbi:hypothetical protein KY290_012495 [Solanum tuberosum]|uniref:Uncharacterized protein n=1 Tax=Solanum tuberosum TaxID=4113 RepID=A0ABQ7W3K0_SOLTU|nr:hypothetical protein KY284_012241 [Solanum tuberosum]KAH0775358.1 hypothetical protein KY290_012495 [Solanum tuberosum]